jgi:hypothetical protein
VIPTTILVVAKLRERSAVSKQSVQIFRVEGFTLKKLDEVEGKQQYRVDISRLWETIRTI